MTSQTFKFVKVAKATPSLAYSAFTNATAMKEWLCDIATVLPRAGGRVFLAWNSGYYTCGEYSALEPDRKVAFSWRGRSDPSASQVRVNIDQVNEGTRITLEHNVDIEGEAWTESIREIEDGWKGSLENLVSVLETGEDLRLTLRPMLGITITDFNAEIAAKEGIPVSNGMRLDGVIDGMGAKAAGLLPNDVIVAMAGRDVRDFADLAAALQRKRAGDVVDVEIYRGSEKMTLAMQLSRRPIPAIPTSIEGLSQALTERAGAKLKLRQMPFSRKLPMNRLLSNLVRRNGVSKKPWRILSRASAGIKTTSAASLMGKNSGPTTSGETSTRISRRP